jgi:Bacterial CdiA-CT RNAse A domain
MSTAVRAAILGRVLAALALLVSSGIACRGPEHPELRAKPDFPRPEQSSFLSPGPGRDLSQDESAGGHTLRKHVGRTDDQLRERLRHERNISAASTWTDRETAEHAVGAALDQNRSKIERWLNREGGHPNLVVDYDGDPSHPIGRSLRRDADQPQPCAHATMVLRWVPPSDYYVLTSYPECR